MFAGGHLHHDEALREVMFTSTILVLLIAIVIALFALPKSLPSGNGSSHPNFLSSGNILLLTAHPDDECLFFAPTLLALTPEVFFLCLSTGDADGLGETRKEELFLSLDVLGVPKERRWVVDNSCVSIFINLCIIQTRFCREPGS